MKTIEMKSAIPGFCDIVSYLFAYLEVFPSLGAEGIKTLVHGESPLLPFKYGALLLFQFLVKFVKACSRHEEPFSGNAEHLDINRRCCGYNILVPHDVVQSFLSLVF